jgi:hypothetical protein
MKSLNFLFLHSDQLTMPFSYIRCWPILKLSTQHMKLKVRLLIDSTIVSFFPSAHHLPLASYCAVAVICVTEAIGRIRRYGQEKMVHIWRFVAQDTIEEEIYRQYGKGSTGNDTP